MSKLIYHSLERTATDTSPFDHAILQVATDSDVRIVSPYIGISYLERIVAVADDWRLISDIEAWLSSLSFRARPRAWEFIRENISQIHHCEQLHAKAVIGEQLATFGSANLTSHGILGRTELGVLIDALEQVHELQSWFDGLWTQTRSPIIDETNAFIKWLDDEIYKAPARRQSFALAGETRKVRARLVRGATSGSQSTGSSLNLARVAQDLLVKEHKHYDSLEAAVASAIDQLATKGFKLGEAVRLVKQSKPDATKREIYLLVLQHCANHPRSVFVEATINRLILTGDRFEQSDKEHLIPALQPFNQFLTFLLQQMTTYEARQLPSEREIELVTKIPGQDQDNLINELIECGLLVLDDRPGELPAYYVGEDFDWSGRFSFFSSAKATYQARIQIPAPAKPIEEAAGLTSATTTRQMRAAFSFIEALQIEQAMKRQEELDRALEAVLSWINNSEVTFNTRDELLASIQKATNIDKAMAAKVVQGQRHLPRVLEVKKIPDSTRLQVVRNQLLTKAHLKDFPRTSAKIEALANS